MMLRLGELGQFFLLKDIVIIVLSMMGGILMASVISHYIDLYVPESMTLKFLLGIVFVSVAVLLRRKD